MRRGGIIGVVGREKEDGLERVPELQVRNYIYKRVICERVKGDLGEGSGNGKKGVIERRCQFGTYMQG